MSQKSFNALLDSAKSALKKQDIDLISLGDPEVGALVKHRVPTSSPVLNKILGGGIPCGRITEIFGEESNGKSSLVADIMANTQKMGGIAVIIDSEQAFDPKRAKAMGVDIDSVIYSDDPTVEGAFSIIEEVIAQTKDSDGIITIVWDSVAQASTIAELDAAMGESQMAVKARLLSKGLRKIVSLVESNIAIVFTNQVRTRFGVTFGKNTEASGGFGLRYATSVRVELTKIGQVKVQDKPVGIKCKAYTAKNKTAAPFKTAEYELLFTGGLDDSNFLLDMMVTQEIIQQKGSWYQYKETKFMRKDFKEFLSASPENQALVEKALEGL